VEAEAVGKDPVIKGDLHHIVPGDAPGHEQPRREFTPGSDVSRRVPDDDLSAAGRRGGVQADHLAQRHGEDSEVVLRELGRS
jgi:hypothetical protein